jgi:hypothetical protein
MTLKNITLQDIKEIKMFSDNDKRNVEMTSQAASLLVQNIQGLVKSNNPLLAEIGLEILQQAVQIEQRLERVNVITRSESDIT